MSAGSVFLVNARRVGTQVAEHTLQVRCTETHLVLLEDDGSNDIQRRHV